MSIAMQIAMNSPFNSFTLLRMCVHPLLLITSVLHSVSSQGSMLMHVVMHDFAIYPFHPHSIAGKMNEMQASLQAVQEAACIAMNANPAYIATSKERWAAILLLACTYNYCRHSLIHNCMNLAIL